MDPQGFNLFPDEQTATPKPGGPLAPAPPTQRPPSGGRPLFPDDDPLHETLDQASRLKGDANHLLDLRLKTGLPPGVIEKHQADIEREVARHDFDAEAFRKTSPKLAQWLAEDPITANAARADLPKLQAIEHTLTWGESFMRGYYNTVAEFGGSFPAFLANLVGRPDVAKTFQAENVRYSSEAALYGRGLTHQEAFTSPSNLAQYVKENVGQQIPVFAVTFASGGAFGGPTFWGQVLAQAPASFVMNAGDTQSQVTQMREEAGETGPQTAAQTAMTFVGGSAVAMLDTMIPGHIGAKLVATFGRETAESIVEQLLAKPIAQKWFVKTAKGTVVGLAGEGFTEGLQQVIQDVTGATATGTRIDWRDLAANATEAAIAGGTVGAVFEAGGVAVTHRAENRRIKAMQAQQQFYDALGKGAAASEFLKTQPAAAQELFQRMTKNGPIGFVYAPTPAFTELFQAAGMNPSIVARNLTGSATALEDAVRDQVDLQIPMAAYAANIAGTALHGPLSKELRLGSPLMANAREIQERLAAQDEEAEAAASTQHSVAQQVVDRLEQQLLAAGHPPRVARSEALLEGERLMTRAERMGEDPLALATALPLQVVLAEPGSTYVNPAHAVSSEVPPSLAPAHETPTQRARRRDIHTEALVRTLTADAQRQDPTVTPEQIRAELETRLSFEDERLAAAHESGQGQELLKAIAAAGGIRYDPSGHYRGEIARYEREGADQKTALERSARRTWNGVAGVFHPEGSTDGQLLEAMLEALHEDPSGRFAGIGDINDLVDAIDQAIRAPQSVDRFPGTEDLADLGIVPGTPWWSDSWARQPEPEDLLGGETIRPTEPGTESDSLETAEGIVSFNPEEFEQRGPGAIPAALERAASMRALLPQAQKGSFAFRRDLKLFLQQQVRTAMRALGVRTLNPSNPRVRDYLVRMAVREATAALETHSNAIGWYDLKVRQALAVVALLHPEIATDEDAAFAFKYALAVTSNGLKVDRNFELAEQAYVRYKATGSFPTNIATGQERNQIDDALRTFNQEVKRVGLAAWRTFLERETTVRELKALGHRVNGEKAETVVRGAAVLGPKIGTGFFANLMGHFDNLTMDRWFVRTWTRWTGNLIERKPHLVTAGRSDVRALIASLSARERSIWNSLTGLALAREMSDAAIDKAAHVIRSKSHRLEQRDVMNRTKAGEALRRVAIRLSVNINGERESPRNKNERAQMREVIQRAQAELARRGITLTLADLQALYWYPERRLYEAAVSSEAIDDGYTDTEAPDYANAAAALARQHGIDVTVIARTLDATAAASATGQPGRAQRDVARASALARQTDALAKRTRIGARQARATANELAQRDYRPRAWPRGAPLDQLNDQLDTLIEQLVDPHRGDGVSLEAHIGAGGDLFVDSIQVPTEHQGAGIGTAIMRGLMAFADAHNLAVSLDQSPNRGKKAALQQFYRRLGFVRNGTARYYDAAVTGAWVRPSISERVSRAQRDELYQGDPLQPPIAVTPQMYSRLVEAVETSTLPKATGAQWKQTIRNYKGGINADEFALAHPDDLEDGRTYTRAEVQQFFEANRPRVETFVYGEPPSFTHRDIEARADSIHQRLVDDAIERLESDDEGAHQWTPNDFDIVEDGEGGWIGKWRFTDSTRENPYAGAEVTGNAWDTEQEALGDVTQELERLNAAAQDVHDQDLRDRAFEEADYGEALLLAEQQLRDENEEREPQFARGNLILKGPVIADSHREVFLAAPSVRGPVANLLGLTEKDRRYLESYYYQEELQKLEFAAREGGEVGARRMLNEWYDREGQAFENPLLTNADAEQARQVRHIIGTLRANLAFKVTLAALDWSDGHLEYDDVVNPIVRLRYNLRRLADGRVGLFLEELQPPLEEEQAKMPALFRKNWRELGMRWALLRAAELKVDVVAWTTGKQQTDRYNLRKVVDRVEYYPGSRQLAAYKRGRQFSAIEDVDGQWKVLDDQGDIFAPGGVHETRQGAERAVRALGGDTFREELREYDVKREDLPKYVGKELAARLLQDERLTPLPPLPTYRVERGVAEGRGDQDMWIVRQDNADGSSSAVAAYHMKLAAERYLITRVAQDKFRAQHGQTAHYRLEGKDLEVGGEGLKRLYDVDLVAKANQVPAMKRTGVVAAANQIQVVSEMLQKPMPARLLPPVTQALAAGARQMNERARVVREWEAKNPPVPVTTAQHGLMMTPALRAALLEGKGPHLFQEDEGGIRAGYTPSTNTIRLIAGKANLSSFLHEGGHQFLEELFADAASVDPNAPGSDTRAQLRVDAELVLRWFGFQGSIEEWRALPLETRRSHHEAWARAFELYLREGKAPSEALRPLFAQFRQWLERVYKAILNLRVSAGADWIEPTAEIRGVMDRLLATDEAIAAAKAEADIKPLFTDAAHAGVDPLVFASYLQVIQRANIAMTEDIDRRVMRDYGREQQAWWQQERDVVRAAVVEEVMRQPELVAQAVMRTGHLPNGKIPDFGDGKPIKFAKDDVVRSYGKDALKGLRMGRDYLYTLEGGFPVDTVATLLGFPTGDALLSALKTGARVEHVIEEETDRRMREKHGDAMLEGIELRDLAAGAVHEHRAAIIGAELNALTTGMASAAIPNGQQLRDAATIRLGATLVRQVKPGLYLQAVVRASQRAFAAFSKNDRAATIRAKVDELTALAQYRAARDIAEKMRGQQKRLLDYDRNPKLRGRVAKAGKEYLDALDQLLEQYEFRRVPYKTLDRREALRTFVDKLQKQSQPVDIPESVLADARQVNWQELTVDELQAVADAADNIVHLARFKDRMLKAQKGREFQAVREELTTSLYEHKGADPKPLGEVPGERRKTLQDISLAHLKLATLARIMDGFTEGPMFDNVIRPLAAAAHQKLEWKAEAQEKLLALFDQYYTPLEQRAFYKREHMPALGAAENPRASINKMGRLLALLNVGNETNRQRLRDGYGWSDAQLQAVIDSLDARDGQFAQAVWDYLETWKPKIAAKERRVKGYEPEWVIPTPVFTPHGELRGGYFPIVFDRELSATAGAHEEANVADLAKLASYVAAIPRAPHLKRRAEGDVSIAVKLSFDSIFGHVDRVIHDLTHHEVLIDIGRLLHGQKGVGQVIVDTHGDAVYQVFKNTLRDIAMGEVQPRDGMEKFVGDLRNGSTVVGLAWNTTTAALQPLGLTQSWKHIGGKWLFRGLVDVLGSAVHRQRIADQVFAESIGMRTRYLNLNREMADVRGTIGLNPGSKYNPGTWIGLALRTVTKNKLQRQAMSATYFSLIQKMQYPVDLITYLGAKDKAAADPANLKDDGTLDTERIIAIAEQAVTDSQGGGSLMDLASVQRGSAYLKLFTNFYSYMNVQYNLATLTKREAQYRARRGERSLVNPFTIGKIAGDYILLFALPAVLTSIIRNAMVGEDDPDEYLKDAVLGTIAAPLGTMLVLRDLTGIVMGFQGYEGPAGLRGVAATGRVIGATGRAIYAGDPEEIGEQGLRALNTAAGVLWHYPAAQVDKTIRGAIALWEGETINPMVLLSGPPPKR